MLSPADLTSNTRLLLETDLAPLQGTRFQPTGFPDLGPARFRAPAQEKDLLLVESAQSMANRLEAVCWDKAKQDWIDTLQGLPYVKVADQNGKFLTATPIEAHRLNSAFIAAKGKNDFLNVLREALEADSNAAVDLQLLARVLLKYDPNSLIHGVFLSQGDIAGGRMRLPRVLTSFVEATNVDVAASGGVKNDSVDPTGKKFGAGAGEGFGNVPFQRDEFTGDIKAFFNVDLGQIRAFGFEPAVNDLLIDLCLFKIFRLLTQDLRLRTACDLQVTEIRVTRPKADQPVTPDDAEKMLAEIEQRLPKHIAACKKHFADPAVTETVFKAKQ
jgi:CRISPR-associated protein Csb1